MAMSAKYRQRQQSIGAMRRAGKPIELEKLVPELSQEELYTQRDRFTTVGLTSRESNRFFSAEVTKRIKGY